MADNESQELLAKRLSELPQQIESTHLGVLVNQLYDELLGAGITFKPDVYLSDGWGCPDRVPVIGIPFYLADHKLWELVSELTGCPIDNDKTTMMYLRHEAGHAFNYAYCLYTTRTWPNVFGVFSAAYDEVYRTVPFSARFVHYSPGWYAQKHADEDFAESFAVWLTPNSNWRDIYRNTPALAKLQFIEEIARHYGHVTPPVAGGILDRPLEELDITVAEWCQMKREQSHSSIILPNIIDEDLHRLFPAGEGEPAVGVFQTNTKRLICDIHGWTGINDTLLGALIAELMRRVEVLNLKIERGKINEYAMRSTVFVTSLAMNHQLTGHFIEM